MPNSDSVQPRETIFDERPLSTQLDLSDDELAEAKDSLRRYFEIGWQIASRLQHEGKLNEVLTAAGVNPTVKPPQAGIGKSIPPETTS